MIRSSKFDVTDQDIAVARNNLEIIARDTKGVNRDNSGWCYLIAPLFSFLTEPRFIRLLRKYKARYYKNGQLQPNWDFLKAMYGESYKKDKQLEKVLHILSSLCRHTDANGQLLPVSHEQQYSYQYNAKVRSPNGITKRQWITKDISSQYVYLVKLVHRIRNQGAIDDMKIMYNYLSDCTAIMSESPNVLTYSTTKKIINGQTVDLTKMKEDLERGLCIVACANGAHIFNIYQYKDENGNKYYRLLNSTPYASYSFKHITNALAAYTPETNQQEGQKYWLCARTEEARVDENKQIGIEKYLKTHSSYLNQINNNNNPFVPGNNNFGNKNINFFPNQNNMNNNKNHNFISNNNHASNKNHFNINNGSNNQNNMNNMFNINNQQFQQMNSYIKNYLFLYNSNVDLIKNHKILTEAKEKYKNDNGIVSKQVYNDTQLKKLNGYNKQLNMCAQQINDNQQRMQMLDY